MLVIPMEYVRYTLAKFKYGFSGIEIYIYIYIYIYISLGTLVPNSRD